MSADFFLTPNPIVSTDPVCSWLKSFYTAYGTNQHTKNKKPDLDNYHAGSVHDHEHYSEAKRRGSSDVYM